MRLIKKIHKKAFQIVTVQDIFAKIVSPQNCSGYILDLKFTKTNLGDKPYVDGTITFSTPIEQSNHWTQLIKKNLTSDETITIQLLSILKSTILNVVIENQDDQNIQQLIQYRHGQSAKINKSFFLDYMQLEPDDIRVKEENGQIIVEANFYLY